MLTKAFFERANALPAPAKAQLSDFLEFLEAKYGASLQPMSNEEYQAFLTERQKEIGVSGKTSPAFEVIDELRAEIQAGQIPDHVPA